MSRASKSPEVSPTTVIPATPEEVPAFVDEGSGEAVPGEYALPAILRLDDETLNEVRIAEALIDQHQRIVQALQQALTQLITKRCRINLDTEHWELDSRRGLLERKDS